MLQDKVTKKISELSSDFSEKNLERSFFSSGFKALNLTACFSEFSHFKSKGYSFQSVLSLLLWMTTQAGKTVNSSLPALIDNGVVMGKDVFFRLKNNEKINWRRLLWHIATKFISQTQNEIEQGTIRCLIFDDTLLEKSGRRIEKIGKVHDHVSNSFKLGFKLLVGLYWDGKSSIPLDFGLFREKGQREEKPYGMTKKELGRQYNKKRMRDAEGVKRIKELDKSKIEIMLQIFYMAVFHSIAIDYVLCDSWFTCQALITAVRSHNVHLIGMYKFIATKFKYQTKMLNYKQINASIKGVTRCRRMKLQYKRADVMLGDIPVTLFFSRQGNNGKWKVILTTDTKLSFVKLIEIYQIRWSVEVFFKECKQLLNLGGCQSSNFDAQIADNTISMIAYILLAFRYRYSNYESMGELFRAMNADYMKQTINKRLWELFVVVLNEICQALEKDIDELFELIMNRPETAKLVSTMMQPPLLVAV